MILLWFTLLLLHRGYTLVPVTTVELGEPATFTCAFANALISRKSIQWYKQSAGDLLKLIMTQQKSTQPEYAPEFSDSRFQVNGDDNFSNLTILRTEKEDEGMYHCAVSEWIIKTAWSGTYLVLKGNTQRTPNYTVVQRPTASDRVRPGDLAGTYYCAVATCGEILFGNEAKVEIECPRMSPEFIALVIAIIGLVISLIGNVVFICRQTSRPKCEQDKESTASEARRDISSQAVYDITESGDDLNYAALHLSGRRATGGRREKELETEESVYSQVKR